MTRYLATHVCRLTEWPIGLKGTSEITYADKVSQKWCEADGTTVMVYEQNGNNPPEPIAIWSRSHE